MYGTHAHRLRVPLDLDAFLLNDQVQRTLSPTALRNQRAGGGYFEAADHSPIGALLSPTPQTVGLALEAPSLDAIETPSAFSPPGAAAPLLMGPGVGVGR